MHQIVKQQDGFSKEDYIKALQDGFVATDTALQEGESYHDMFNVDRHYEDEPSGCTATTLLITDKNVVYVVCQQEIYLSIGKCWRFTDSSWSQRSRNSIVKGSQAL